ncbi:MAG: hypothetical protein C7B43_17535 [Sulfobacillus benefaciens]|uniref:Uncharacterized protein n=1 Tax=Sulfobacillus benefaciens TaxID=453960 RepID=A0A2T2WS92_9FIRM|nr:MAG: hypothetical protein C7B43_17535 [Sulfobacillus benefaciens]HBQ96459.1 hypothetical protein [Sulfobacillus sp.]
MPGGSLRAKLWPEWDLWDDGGFSGRNAMSETGCGPTVALSVSRGSIRTTLIRGIINVCPAYIVGDVKWLTRSSS